MAQAQLLQKPPFSVPDHGSVAFRLAGYLARPLVGENDRLVIRCRNGGPALELGSVRGRRFTMTLDKPETFWEIIRNPDPRLGETYMAGRWSLDEGDIGAFMSMLAAGRQKMFHGPAGRAFQAVMNLTAPPDYSHDPENSRKFVQHHYDIGNDLYELFLDEGLNYSCAFFENPQMTLREAQLHKICTAIKRLDIRPGMRVLDIGCGWGNTARLIAKETQAAEVHGITLAENQLHIARQKAQRMHSPPEFFLRDYRDHANAHKNYYDRIVSIGMFEHVGHENGRNYFEAIRRQLRYGGKALVHSIVRSGAPATRDLSSPWLDTYIFPGGCIPEVEDMVEYAQREGLQLDHEPYIHGSFHYAETLRRWRKNFMDARAGLDPARYDQRFKRMWEFYLAMCEAMFDGCGYRVAQIVFRNPH